MAEAIYLFTGARFSAAILEAMAVVAQKLARVQGYEPPNYRARLAVDTFAAGVSPLATVKGFYCSALLKEAASCGQHLSGYGPYREFKDYPQHEAIRLLAEVARRVYPDEPMREALRRLGWIMFPTLLTTVIGKVVFGALGDNIPAVIRMAPRGFEVSMRQGEIEVLSLGDREAELRVSNCYLFPDSFFVGVFEGTFAHYGKDARVLIRNSSANECEYLTTW